MYKVFWNQVISPRRLSNGHYIANCPLCGETDGHFYANYLSGQWDCKKCQAKGNAVTFLRDHQRMPDAQIANELNRLGIASTSESQRLPQPKSEYKIFDEKMVDYYCSQLSTDKKAEFAAERGLSVEILDKYRLGINDIGEFTLPVFDTQGKIRNILRKKPGESTISIQGGEGLLFGVEDLIAPVIFVVEGPWSAMALKERGFKAVGTPGAGILKDSQVDLFKSKEVYLIPDNDEPGRKGMASIAQKLRGVAESVYTISLPVPEKKDARDFFKAGGTVDQLEELIKQARENPSVMAESEIEKHSSHKKLSPVPSYDEFIKQEFPPVEFFIGSVDGGALLQKNGITMISAEFGKGKTLLGLNMAWAITKGVDIFLGFPVKKARGLYLIFEGGNSSFQKRLKAIGEGESNPDLYVKCIVHSFNLTPTGNEKTEDQKEFEEEIERLKVDFVVIDNAANVFSGDENDQKQVKPFMDYLISVKEKFRVSFIILRHWKKTQAKGGSPKRQMATGSIWWLNAVDNQICLSGESIDSIILSTEKERNCASFSPKVVTITKPDLHFKFLKDFASNGPRYTEDNTLLPAWESFGATRVKQTDLVVKMTQIVQAGGAKCSKRTASGLLDNSKRFFKTPIVPGSRKSGNWIALKPDSGIELFDEGEDNVS